MAITDINSEDRLVQAAFADPHTLVLLRRTVLANLTEERHIGPVPKSRIATRNRVNGWLGHAPAG